MSEAEKDQWSFFTSPLPPKAFREFVAAPHFANTLDGQQKHKVYEKLLGYASGDCPSFDRAAEVLSTIESHAQNTPFSPTELTAILQQVKEESAFLDQGWIRAHLSQR